MLIYVKMKSIKISIAFLAFMFCSTINAQNGYDRNNGVPNSPQNTERTKEEIEKAQKENLAKFMSKLKEDLNLDALQEIAIQQIFSENMKLQGIILKKEVSDEDKASALKSLAESTEKKVTDLLNAEQKEKYEKLKTEKPKEKEVRKKKKEKKKIENRK
jgi:hypothetical protein